MKIYSGYPGGITKITNGKDFYQTEDLSNVITVYVDKTNLTGITYSLTLEFLRADNRKTTLIPQAFEVGDDTTLTEDGVTYDIHNFVLTETQLAVAGTLAFTCYITIFNNSNVVVSRGALFNAVSNVRKTVTYSANTIFVVSEDDKDVPIIVADMKTAIETLSGQLASKVNKADVADNLTTNDSDKVLSAKQGYILKAMLDALEAATYTKTEVDSALALKADKSDTYTKTETDALLANKADKSTTCTKTEVDGLAHTLKYNQKAGYTTNGENGVDFIIGVYSWFRKNPAGTELVFMQQANRLTAFVKDLNLKLGDTVGITDYTTYSIAFGENGNGTHTWYDNGYNTNNITANNPDILPYIILFKRNDNANITDADIETIKNQFFYSNHITYSTASMNYLNRNIKTSKNCFLHLSFDDVEYCLKNLKDNDFYSLWAEPFFAMLKKFHEDYNVVFSLYVYNIANISGLPAKYKNEFIEASSWLKFGFHSYSTGTLENATYNQAQTEYNEFLNAVYDKCGGTNSIDRMPRLNYFGGSLEALRGLRDADCGCIGFLSADDDRQSYYLDQYQLDYLKTHSLLIDNQNGLNFIPTTMRLEWFDNFTSNHTYNTPVENNPYDELVYRYYSDNFADLYSRLIVFTHEWKIYSSSYVINSTYKGFVEDVCRFGKDYNYDNDYPQNRVSDIRSYNIDGFVSGSTSIDITNNVVSVKQSYIDGLFLTDAEMTTLLSEVFD